MKDNDWQVVEQPGDGNCLLHSLLDQFELFQRYEDTRAYDELRNILCDYMEKFFAEIYAEGIVQSFLEEEKVSTKEEYMQKMRRDKTYLGQPALEAAIAAFPDVRINVHEVTVSNSQVLLGQSSFPMDESQKLYELNIIYSGRVHYDSLHRKGCMCKICRLKFNPANLRRSERLKEK